MVLTGMKLSPEHLIAKYGRERTRRMHAGSLESIDCVEQIVQEENVDCSFSRCGHLEVACKPSHFAGYSRSAELMAREFNHQVRIVSEPSCMRRWIAIYYGGLLDEKSAGLNPAKYVAGLASAAQGAGARIYEHSRVSS